MRFGVIRCDFQGSSVTGLGRPRISGRRKRQSEMRMHVRVIRKADKRHLEEFYGGGGMTGMQSHET